MATPDSGKHPVTGEKNVGDRLGGPQENCGQEDSHQSVGWDIIFADGFWGKNL